MFSGESKNRPNLKY